jgi:hypothetical protein
MTSFLRFVRPQRAALALISSVQNDTTSWTIAAAAAAAAFGVVTLSNHQQKAECGGIAAVVGSGSYDARYVLQ